MPFSYTKLRDGSWGVRVDGETSLQIAQPGQTVTVTRRDGTTKVETIDKIIWSNFNLAFCSLKREEDAASATPCDASKALAYVSDSFVFAIGQGLKRPMLRLHHGDRRFKVYLSKRGTVCVKTGHIDPGTHDPVGDEEYMGCLLRGRFMQAKQPSPYRRYEAEERINDSRRPLREMDETEQTFLAGLKDNPVGFIAQCGRDMDRCVYCGQPLEDPVSKAVGYGKVCAGRYGLPWGSAEYCENAPSFSKSYDDHAAGLCESIRLAPRDETNWLVLADWCSEKGLRCVEMPKDAKTLPRIDPEQVCPAPKVETPAPTPAPEPAKPEWDLDPEPAPAPKANGVPVIDGTRMTYLTRLRTLTADASDFGLDGFPPAIDVKGKLAIKRFTLSRVEYRDGEATHADYAGVNGYSCNMRLYND